LQDHLRVRRREEAVAVPFQLAPELGAVVDAAVERQRQAKLAVDHRLLARAREIDDGQRPVNQPPAAALPLAGGVRSAAAQCRAWNVAFPSAAGAKVGCVDSATVSCATQRAGCCRISARTLASSWSVACGPITTPRPP